jgi:hypothetical protein
MASGGGQGRATEDLVSGRSVYEPEGVEEEEIEVKF